MYVHVDIHTYIVLSIYLADQYFSPSIHPLLAFMQVTHHIWMDGWMAATQPHTYLHTTPGGRDGISGGEFVRVRQRQTARNTPLGET
mmetsp:Transcript_46987/g.117174  ORF Transcript_46987/g.117174 Transcript_46987/m.117174 type:complete len:87 (-) Transcript_46987:130-390(-)